MVEFFGSTDEQTFISMRGMIKRGGTFKSAKQRDFLLKSYTDQMLNVRETFDRAQREVKKFFGIDLREGEVYVSVDAFTRWADYGSRSVIPMLYVFILDRFGVARQYKVNGNGNSRDGWAPNPEKCKLMWERPADAELPVFEEPVAAEPKKESSWFANVGEKVTVKVKVKAVKDLGYSRFGKMEITVFEDENGNVINVWKAGYADIGAELTIKGTVKACDEYRGVKQTTLVRVKEV